MADSQLENLTNTRPQINRGRENEVLSSSRSTWDLSTLTKNKNIARSRSEAHSIVES